MTASVLLRADGGEVTRPARGTALIDRADGGHLIVHPPRAVWERSELTARELAAWALLVAATGRAMLDVLDVLHKGCINYWEAGNWSLHEDAEPRGPKDPREHRRVHAHVIGRSRTATHPSWRWGEAPQFPRFADRVRWSAPFNPLTAAECAAVASRISYLLDPSR